MKKTLIIALSVVMISPIFADGPLGDAMSEMNSHLKSIRKAESFEAKAEAVRSAQAELLKCLDLVPSETKAVKDTAERTKLIAEYKQMIAQNFALLCEYELAFLAEDEAKSKEIYTKLREIKKAGHDKYYTE